MSFNGSEGKPIDLNVAATWTTKYRDSHPNEVYSHFFGSGILQQLLKQPGCQGIRLYYGLDGATPQLVAVGANGEEDDQLGSTFIVADDTPTGPPHCGQANVLNS